MVQATTAARGPEQAPATNGGDRPEALVESYRRLAEVFHHVLSEQSLDALLERIADTLAALVPYEALTIYEADEGRRMLQPMLARTDYHDEVMRNRPRFGEGLTGWAVQHRRPVWTNRAHLDPRASTVAGTPNEPEAMIVVPLIARGTLKGALNIYRIGEEAAFYEHEFELAKYLGDAAALAIDNAQVRARLEHLAQTDSLTGLYNHRFFHERLRAELTRASRQHDAVAVLMFDLDDFKRVNDVYGHGAGDQLLIQIARLAKETVRASDVVCRIGGEEFGVIMPSCDAGDALGLASRLIERLRGLELEPMGRMTLSIGVSQGPQHAMNPRELIACAEAAMMTAKARGKNQVVLYDDDGATERPAMNATTAGRDVRSIAHLKMLQSLAGKLNRLNDVRQIGDTIASELRLLIDYHNCRVFLREGEDLVPITFLGDFEPTDFGQTPLEAFRTKVGVGVTGRAVETGKSMLVGNALDCEFAHRIEGTEELDESLAAVPLRYGSRVTGAIVISKLGTDQFDEDDVRLLEVLAGQASVALENARLYEAQRREAEGANALLAFLADVSQAASFAEICQRTVDTAAALFETEAASLWLQDASGDFSRAAAHGIDNPYDGLLTREHVVDRVIEHREPFRGEAALVAPLLSGDGITGWIAVAKDDPQHVPDSEMRLLAAFSFQASVALQKARLYWQQQESAEIANALLDAGRELSTADTIGEVIRRAVELTSRALASDRVSLWLQEEDGARELVVRGAVGHPDGDPLGQARYPASLAEQGLCVAEPFILEPHDLSQISGVDPAKIGRYAIAPLHFGDSRFGALVAHIDDGRDFGHRQLRLLSGLAHQARLAIEGAENYKHLERTFLSTVASLANALEANDAYTSSHARWITDVALLVGGRLDLERDAMKRLELGALFHDIGKIGIPSEILQKAGPLTDEERRIVEGHPELGEKILAPIDRLADVRPIVRACHERWDGLGYPDGRAGEDIPIEARIVLVCDAYHAMVTDRPYRKALAQGEALRRLRESAGTQFDPLIVAAFAGLLESGAIPAAA
ncbi:MAG TPA: diguanylate cyclase [Gaiellaceae bacterium]|nr:diguanylate cyclase [Gaiellaceae bacterium]